MALYRPHIPLSVKVQVAERQVRESGSVLWPLYLSGTQAAKNLGKPWSLTRKLRVLLGDLFPYGNFQLDHDPALEQRSKGLRKGKSYYIPDANHPEYLVYRTKALHLMKTTGRKPGAEKTATSKGSDVWIAKKFRRLEGRVKPRRKVRIQSRPFQKGKRKFNGQ